MLLHAIASRSRKLNDPSERFRMSRRTTVTAAWAVLATLASDARAETKVSQSAVHYQASPNEGKDCDDCANFVSPGGCKLVDGAISPKGWCRLWVKRAS